MPASGVVEQVIVKRSDMAAAQTPRSASKLVFAVDWFLHRMTKDGYYSRHELPARAVIAYRAATFYYHVSHGGPEEVIEFSGECQPQFDWSLVLEGLAAMGADAHHELAVEMSRWLARYPHIAALRAAPESERKLLKRIETRFNAIEKTTPLFQLAGRWIASWPELQVVDDEEYEAAIQQLVADNPLSSIAQICKDIQRINRQLLDPREVALAFACTSLPRTEGLHIKLIHGTQWNVEIDGEPQVVIQVRTTWNLHFGLQTDTYTAIYERIEIDPLLHEEDVSIRKKNPRFRVPTKARIGKRLSCIPIELTNKVIALAHAYRLSVAMATMLRKLGVLEDPSVYIAPLKIVRKPEGPAVDWIVANDTTVLMVRSGPDETVAVNWVDSELLDSLTKHEIDKLAQEVEALERKLKSGATTELWR